MPPAGGGAARCPSCSRNAHDEPVSFDARSIGQPRRLPYREVVRIGEALLDSLLEHPASQVYIPDCAGQACVAGSLALRNRGTFCGYPEGAGRPVYADGDCPI